MLPNYPSVPVGLGGASINQPPADNDKVRTEPIYAIELRLGLR